MTVRNDSSSYWDRRAETFSSSSKVSSYPADLLSRIDIFSSDTVLDIGCGNGLVTIPLAEKVKSITAIDSSAGMLSRLLKKAAETGTENIGTLLLDWEKAGVGRDISSHDVVLASRCIPRHDPAAWLRKMTAVTNRVCYMTWRTDSYDLEKEIGSILGAGVPSPSTYPDIAGILEGLGIVPQVETFESTHHEQHAGMEDAVRNLARGESFDEAERQALTGLVEKYYTIRDGIYTFETFIPWKLVSWEKP